MKAVIKIELLNYWHAGTGRSSGSHLDALSERDGTLPVLAGRHLKGLLRYAFFALRQWHGQWQGGKQSLAEYLFPGLPDDSILADISSAELENLLFGSAHYQADQSNKGEEDLRSSLDTLPGMLRISSGQLSAGERAWLAKNKGHEAYLFDELFSTAIDPATGSAKDASLRGIEVCLPMTLYADISLDVTSLESHSQACQRALMTHLATTSESEQWHWLNQILPMMDAVGGKRNRGAGEAKLSVLDRQSVADLQGAA